MATPIIKTKDLNVIYSLGKSNQSQVLKNINLEIYPEEFVILFGPSGCGKSTLLYSLAGLETNTQGQIFVQEQELSSLKPREMEMLHQKSIGMVFQEFYLIPTLSILNNVVLPQIAIGGDKKTREKKAMELLESFSVGKQAKKMPSELSGGQKQRVAICRSIMNDPDIVFADEPVGNLDSKSADEVMELLKRLNSENKKTVVLVTHNPAHLSYAHRVFYIKDGQIIRVAVNKAINKEVEEKAEEKASVSISKEYELIARCFSTINNMGILLVPFKAKEIVSEVLTGMTYEEVTELEKKVAYLIKSGVPGNEDFISNYLDTDEGGMGMDKRKAFRLGKKITDVIKEVKLLEYDDTVVEKDPQHLRDKEVIDARIYLFDTYDVVIKDINSLRVIEDAIRMRLNNEIDKATVQDMFDKPLKDGGAELDHRKAKKMAKHLELLILGKLK